MSRATVYSKEHRVVSKHPVDADDADRLGARRRHDHEDRYARVDLRRRRRRAVWCRPRGRRGRLRPRLRASRSTSLPSSSTSTTPTSTALFTGSVVATAGRHRRSRRPSCASPTRARRPIQLTSAQAEAPKADAAAADRACRAWWRASGAVVTAGSDRRVAADQADFDAKADTALFLGNVVVNQQKNVLQGRRLFVDRKNNKSRLDSPARAAASRLAASPPRSIQAEGKAASPPSPRSRPAPRWRAP